MEGVTAAAFFALASALGWSWDLVAGSLFAGLLIALSAIDAERRLLPDALTLPLVCAGLIYNAIGGFVAAEAAIFGAAAGYGAFWGVSAAYRGRGGARGAGRGRCEAVSRRRSMVRLDGPALGGHDQRGAGLTLYMRTGDFGPCADLVHLCAFRAVFSGRRVRCVDRSCIRRALAQSLSDIDVRTTFSPHSRVFLNLRHSRLANQRM